MLYELWAPKRPGLELTKMGVYHTLVDARRAAWEFSVGRPWLKGQDVVIYQGDQRVEFAGPAK